MNNPQIRLNKFLAERLGASRREADDLIVAGKVTVDGQTAVLGTKIDDKSKVFYNKKLIPFETKYVYLAFNKPVGYVCSRRAQGPAPTLYNLLPTKYQKLKTVGRLDKDSSGLILLTNDGDFAFQMTHPKFRKTKVYEVELNKPLKPLHQQMISDYGVLLDDGPSKFTVIKKEDKMGDSRAFATTGVSDEASPVTTEQLRERKASSLAFPSQAARPLKTGASEEAREAPILPSYIAILTEGRNRQIRRTFAALGYRVVKLHRTHFGKYELGHLKSGKYDIIEP